jgi:hypothetical protein
MYSEQNRFFIISTPIIQTAKTAAWHSKKLSQQKAFAVAYYVAGTRNFNLRLSF